MIRRLVLYLILGCVGAFFFRQYGFEGIYLASDSMAPTLPEGTHVVVNKFIFHIRSPKRGEIVVFDLNQNDDKGHVKRIIGIAGDSIEIKNKIVYLNNELLQEPYVQYSRREEILMGDNLSRVVIPEGCVFVMGDNRDFSHDSRDWKTINGEPNPFLSTQQIRGLVLLTT